MRAFFCIIFRWKTSILITAMLLVCFALSAQLSLDKSFCPSEEIAELTLKKDTQFFSQYLQLEENYQRASRQYFSSSSQKRNEHFILPIVVHIVHDGGDANISDIQISNAITLLNNGFANEDPYNPLNGVDTDLSFCLAKRDPSGNPTSGINRIESIYTDADYPANDSELKDLIRWDTEHYINIWVVNSLKFNGQFAAGYASLPYAHGTNYEGIVVDKDYFGRYVSSTSTILHEMGHYLGLYHTFREGCTNDNCLQNGDKVCDTPPDASTISTPCMKQINSCQSDEDDQTTNNPFRPISLGGLGDQSDMSDNYMDYSTKLCQDNFTQGQKERMHFFLSNIRYPLLESKACLDPCTNPVIAQFSVSQTSVIVEDEVILTNQSINAEFYQWRIDDVLYAVSKDTIIHFEKEGIYTISLLASTDYEACEEDIFEIVIEVICPTEASITYNIYDQNIDFTAQSLNAYAIQWNVYNVTSELIFSSDSSSGEITNLSEGYYHLCITALGTICNDSICHYIYIAGDSTEVCDNGIDDDYDGFVDLFDNDCDCDDSAYQAYCPIDCEFIPEDFPDFSMKLKWQSKEISNLRKAPNIIAGDINQDGTVEIISYQTFKNELSTTSKTSNEIVIINGLNGEVYTSFLCSPDSSITHFYEHFSMADINNDGQAEIFVDFEGIKSYSVDGDLLWEADTSMNTRFINLIDFNGDGIVELYANEVIFNAVSGKVIAIGNRNGSIDNRDYSQHSIAADLLPSPGLELAAGNVVYDLEINNPAGKLGNNMVKIQAEESVRPGYTTVADIDGDGELDVICLRTNDFFHSDGGIWVWNPRTTKIIAQADVGELGGIPFVGDVNGDCVPEIGMTFKNELRMYTYDSTTNLKLLYSLPTSDKSGKTGITMFDFNQDGANELVYRDQNSLRIIEGYTGQTLFSYPIYGGTIYEYPIIVDIDNDGEAEIIINGSLSSLEASETRIFCFESDEAPWAPARPVWNQYGYNPTYINDDLSVPRYPQHSASFFDTDSCVIETCSQPYNNFMVQATYRTQQGCIQFPTIDLRPSIIQWYCHQDSLFISYVVHNQSDAKTCKDSFGLQLYDGNPFARKVNSLLQEKKYLFIPREGASDTFYLSIPIPELTGFLYLLINDGEHTKTPIGFPLSEQVECDFDNNLDSIAIHIEKLVLDIGPDISLCKNGVVNLIAPLGFERYLWGDGSTELGYTSSFDGLHFLEATDQCGRKYYDTMRVSIDHQTILDIGGAVLEICPGDSLSYEIMGDFDRFNWFPVTHIDCDTCRSVKTSTDTSFWLVAIGEKSACYSSDSIFISVKETETINWSQTICQGDSVWFFDTYLFEEDMYEYIINDCDTIYQLELEVIATLSSNEKRRICSGDSILVGDVWLYTTDTYEIYTLSSLGCDSVINIDLMVEDHIFRTDSLSICEGDSIMVFGDWINEDIVLEQTFISQVGCDSTQIFQVYQIPTTWVYDTIQICIGDSSFIHNRWTNQPGAYLDTIDNGVCGIIEQVILKVNETYVKTIDIDLCPKDSILIGNVWLSKVGLYEFTAITLVGCDTSFIVNVTQLDIPEEPNYEVDCEALSIMTSIDLTDDWQITWSNGATVENTSYTEGGIISVELFYAPDCYETYELELPELPIISEIPYFSDTMIDPSNSINLSTGLDETIWSVEWSPASIIDCSDCMDVVIHASQDVQVSLNLTHISGCVFTKEFSILVNEADQKFDIPNIFSPNDDGDNDIWTVSLPNHISKILEGAIYDRWGNQIVSWQNTNEISWDGTFKGTLVHPNVFVYYLKYATEGVDGSKIIIKKGDVMVLR